MTNTYTDQTTSAPILNFYSSESQLTSQSNPSPSELHMIPAGGVSFPSDRYIDFTLPASGSGYTVPADGWVYLAMRASASNQYIQILMVNNNKYAVSNIGPSSNFLTYTLMPVKASQRAVFFYTLAGEIVHCRFIYANGTPNVSAS